MRRVERQVLATDFWSQCMTAFVAVCLTLTSPYVFKIAKSFLVWLMGHLAWLTMRWNDGYITEPTSSSSSATGSRTQLLPSQVPDYGTSEAPDHGSGSNAPDGQQLSVGASRAVKSQSASQSDVVKGTSGGQDPQVLGLSPAAETNSESKRRMKLLRGDQGLADTLEDAQDSREVTWKFIESLRRGGAEQAKPPSTMMTVIITVLFGLFIAQAVAGVFSAKIASDRAGLSSSQSCGIWQFNENAGGEAADRDDLNNYQKEARASQYARTCYNSPNPTDPFSCGIFYNQSIAYTTRTHQPCPFASVELCHDGLYSAISFDTGHVDASVIGINSPATYKFRRTTSCSPLNMSEPYVLRSSPDIEGTAYDYYYGRKDDTSYTFNTSGRPFEWLVPVYSVK